jgi:hypothetical protein
MSPNVRGFYPSKKMRKHVQSFLFWRIDSTEPTRKTDRGERDVQERFARRGAQEVRLRSEGAAPE